MSGLHSCVKQEKKNRSAHINPTGKNKGSSLDVIKAGALEGGRGGERLYLKAFLKKKTKQRMTVTRSLFLLKLSEKTIAEERLKNQIPRAREH